MFNVPDLLQDEALLCVVTEVILFSNVAFKRHWHFTRYCSDKLEVWWV